MVPLVANRKGSATKFEGAPTTDAHDTTGFAIGQAALPSSLGLACRSMQSDDAALFTINILTRANLLPSSLLSKALPQNRHWLLQATRETSFS